MKARIDRLIERYFEGDSLTDRETQTLFAAIEQDPKSRAYFDELAQFERALSEGPQDQLSASELSLIGRTVVEAVKERERERRVPRWIGALAAVAALGLAVISLPKGEGLTPKGGLQEAHATIEVLCFDQDAEVVSHLDASGTCPTPGFLKLVFASPRTVPELHVMARTRDGVVLERRVQRPKPRSVLDGHLPLKEGETVEIFVDTQHISDGQLEVRAPSITVKGRTP